MVSRKYIANVIIFVLPILIEATTKKTTTKAKTSTTTLMQRTTKARVTPFFPTDPTNIRNITTKFAPLTSSTKGTTTTTKSLLSLLRKEFNAAYHICSKVSIPKRSRCNGTNTCRRAQCSTGFVCCQRANGCNQCIGKKKKNYFLN